MSDTFNQKFDEEYDNYKEELCGIGYLLTGIRVDRKELERLEKEAVRRLVIKFIQTCQNCGGKVRTKP